MQIMFGTILCVLLKGLVLTKATITFRPTDYTISNDLQKENLPLCPLLNFTQDISEDMLFDDMYFMRDMSEKSDHHILNFKSDQSHSDIRKKREDDEVTLANISIIPESIDNSLNKPTSLRAFVQFDSQFAEKVNDIFVTLRWNQPEFTDEIIGYQVQCSFFEDFKEICDAKTIAATKLEHTVHNLTSNTTYYFRVRAYTKIVNKIVAGPYTDLIKVSTTHENLIPKLLLTTDLDMEILDVDLRITNILMSGSVTCVAYSIQEHRIYWLTEKDLMTWKMNENNITKIASFDYYLNDLCIDWVARNLYIAYKQLDYSYIVKIDLTMWENGIIKFDDILISKIHNDRLNVSPSRGILYSLLYNWTSTEYNIMKYHLDRKIEQIVPINTSLCLFHDKDFIRDMIIDDMNNEEPLIYWLFSHRIFVTDINVSMCNKILHKKNVSDNIDFQSMTIDKTNIYILTYNSDNYTEYTHIYVLNKKYASLKSVNADEYVEKIISGNKQFYEIHAFDRSLQSYPPTRCLTPDEKDYNFENVNAMANSILVNLPEPIVKTGCKKYNLPTTMYTISVSCLDNNFNKSEKFNVTFERYHEIQNLTPFTEYKLKFTLSNFYFDQLSINPFDSNVISIKTNSGKLDAPENISVVALTPTIAVVHWMPLKKVYCVAVTYEVHWKSVIFINGTQQEGKQFINMPKRTADGRFFTKINLTLQALHYMIHVRVYPNNFSDFYNESLSNYLHIYSEPNNITLSEVNINSMDVSWISNINLTMFCTLEYKDIGAEEWQAMNYIKMNYNKEVTYHVDNLQSGTLYKFRLIMRYPEYEENFTWPIDERFIFSTLDPETCSMKSKLSNPTSLRTFVQFDRNQFTEKDIFVTLRWNQPGFIDKIIQGYTEQCFFKDLEKIQTCDDKNITTTKLEHTMHNLISNTTYYFRVRANTEMCAGPFTDLINVSTAHENPIPKFLLTSRKGIHIFDMDLNIIDILISESVINIAYSIQEHRIYWCTKNDIMTLKINENSITKVASFDHDLRDVCIDWVARNLYFTYEKSDYNYIVKFDLTMWENGIIKFDEIFKTKNDIRYLNVLPSMGILYNVLYNWKNTEYDIMKYHLDTKMEQIVRINASSCLLQYINSVQDVIVDNMNNEEPLIYWLIRDRIFVTNTIVFKCNEILRSRDISDNILFETMTIDKTNIYILASEYVFQFTIYVLNKKYASLKTINAAEYVEKVNISSHETFDKIYVFNQSLQTYPPMRCLTPDEKDYNFENVNAMANSIIVNLPEPVVKSGCEKYNLPTTTYTISVSHCLNNNLNKSEKFNVLRYVTCERYYEIQNLTPFTEYIIKFTLSNFYFDQLSINPFDSNVISLKTNSGKLDAPENISVVALTPTIAAIQWIPPKKVNCLVVTYEVHWKSVTLINGTQQEGKQIINMPKRTADGRFFTKVNLSLPVQDYLIYVRVYPNNFSDFYNESLSKIDHIYSEPNNFILSEVNINSMNISWISNINLTISAALEYKDIGAEKWQTMNYIKINYNKEVTYYVKNLQSGTSYMFRLILRYPEYEENFTWPTDERFIFPTLDIPSNPGIIGKKYYLLLMLSFIVIVIIICVYYFYYLYRQRKVNNEQFLSSSMTDMELAILHEPCQYSEFNSIYSPMLHCNPDECAITKIARKQITLSKLIGSGAFGMVFQGNVKNLERSGTEISVAIKTLRKDASSHEKKNLLKEAKLMNHFRHKHVLRLLAVCLDGDSPLLVLELMETGDLLKYLRDCRNLQASDSSALRLQDLLAMCEDVARGCCYLEELRFVHRDLACRNCLVSSRNREDRVIKIGDFGLARDIYKDNYYRMKGERWFPIRWMAPESLMIEIFTSQSDVWSFGVLMWEITSLGEKPYMDKNDKEVIYHVRAGGRLPMALNCPSPLYQLMLRCWSAADARPDFKFCLENIIALRKNMEDSLLSPVDPI